jgi:cytidine deaminase
MNQLKKKHFYLIETAKKIINMRFKEKQHHFVAAIRASSEELYTGLHLRTSLEKDDVCAEMVALANAFANGETELETLVIVNRIGDIVNPCGKCREVLFELCPNIEVILSDMGGGRVVKANQLLPFKKCVVEGEGTED